MNHPTPRAASGAGNRNQRRATASALLLSDRRWANETFKVYSGLTKSNLTVSATITPSAALLTVT